jgi:hypothetical protein
MIHALFKKFWDENYAAGGYDVQNVNLCVTRHKKSLHPVQEFIVLHLNSQQQEKVCAIWTPIIL